MTKRHRVFVGTIGQGVFRSLDGGESFSRAADGMFVECHVRALTAHPRNPRIIYLGSEQGLFRSVDGGDLWSRVESPLDGLQIWSILLPSHAPDTIIAGTCPSRVFRSTDAGRNWIEGPAQIRQECPRIMHTRVTSLLVDCDLPETIWAGVEIDGLFRSTDSGQSWQHIGQGLSSLDIHALAIAPGTGGSKQLLAATNNDLNMSRDGGESWQPLQIGEKVRWSYCRSLAQVAGRPHIVLLGIGNGPPGSEGAIARSTDAGTTWVLAEMPARANSTIWTFAVHLADPELIYAASVSGEVYRSTDAGSSWTKLKREFGEIRALTWTPD
jgi:photosystem II stability/assembly factor-like uncharacterized protein